MYTSGATYRSAVNAAEYGGLNFGSGMSHGPNVASIPPASAIARTASAATGSSGLTPHHAQESTVCGGAGGPAACAEGVATPRTNAELITSAAKLRVRRDMA